MFDNIGYEPFTNRFWAWLERKMMDKGNRAVLGCTFFLFYFVFYSILICSQSEYIWVMLLLFPAYIGIICLTDHYFDKRKSKYIRKIRDRSKLVCYYLHNGYRHIFSIYVKEIIPSSEFGGDDLAKFQEIMRGNTNPRMQVFKVVGCTNFRFPEVVREFWFFGVSRANVVENLRKKMQSRLIRAHMKKFPIGSGDDNFSVLQVWYMDFAVADYEMEYLGDCSVCGRKLFEYSNPLRCEDDSYLCSVCENVFAHMGLLPKVNLSLQEAKKSFSRLRKTHLWVYNTFEGLNDDFVLFDDFRDFVSKAQLTYHWGEWGDER